MTLVLAINTATPHAGIALLKDGVILEEVTWLQGTSRSVFRPYANLLASKVKDILDGNEILPTEFDFLTVTVGPGSFTGVRSGVSFAKGFALAGKIPLVPVQTLEALAWQSGPGKICPLIDARRGEFYWGIYQVEEGELKEIVGASLGKPEEIESQISRFSELTFSGEPLWRKESLPPIFREGKISPRETWCLRAKAVGELGLIYFKEGKIQNPEEFLPFYLRGV